VALRTGLLALVVLLSVAASAVASDQVSVTGAQASKPPERRVFLLGLHQRGEPSRFARLVSNPYSPQYGRFLSLAEYRQRFGPRRAARRYVRRFLASQRGVRKVELSADGSVVLAVLTPRAGQRLFCARGGGAPSGRLCTPAPLRGRVRQISAGELYQLGSASSARQPKARAAQGCADATRAGEFTPAQLSTAYGVDPLHARSLDGSGVRVATLSSQKVDAGGFRTWARCFGLSAPVVRQPAMPGATRDTGTAPEETVLDVEALASLAPGLERITPIYVPLDQSFSHSFVLFMFGALDPSRQGGRLPHILSLSDGVCESRFTRDQLQLGRRLLVQAAALGITTLAASGDAGFLGCNIPSPGAMFPSSSPFTTSVGGTDLTLTGGNEIASQVVWSTYATEPDQGVGTGGGPSKVWRRPSFQQAPGLGPQLQQGSPTRLAPDVASMASFTPGIATFDKDGGGWGIGGGTSAATPLTAAIAALVLQQERAAGRPPFGSLSPLLYALARGPDYGSIFFDVTSGTSSPRPSTPAGQSPPGGAAQPGYDMATGLGSLKAAAFANAVASLRGAPVP
jgi:subtilase family serine protease